MPSARRQDFRTRSFFECRAAIWDRHYMPNGAMLGRVARFVDAMADFRFEPGCLLDFGCGTGEIARAIASHGWEVIGCDAAPAMVEKARSANDEKSVEWVVLEADGILPFAAAKFEVVIASSVFEYLGDPPSALKEIARVLAPGGRLLATVPDMRHPYREAEEARRRLLRIPLLRLLLQLTPWRHVANYLHLSTNRFPIDEWCAILQAVNLRPELPPPCEDPLLLLRAEKVIPLHD